MALSFWATLILQLLQLCVTQPVMEHHLVHQRLVK
jgi:hypothetical protein